jgi:3-deoxy-D-manno-octulosonate 8-phosphate phosphatase (KDO 8-P phosphatase)
MSLSYKEKFRNITTFVFDVDGVLTDGSLLVMTDGEFLRRMNIKDGYAMQLAIKKGYHIAIISGGHSSGVPLRLKRLGIQEVHMGVGNKLTVFNEMMERFNVSSEKILVMGDDMPDIDMLSACGLPCCPSDAVQEVKNISNYISPYKGGKGCVRDVIEQVLKVQNNWE